MKRTYTHKLILLVSSLFAATSFQSCLKDQEDVFEDSVSARMQAYLETVRTTLTEPEYGWRMEYYAGNSKQDYGGYNFALKFTDEEVTAGSELDPELITTSLYTLKSDNGPVLSFDTYSEVLHSFAVPGWNKYEGKGGDFEFMVTDVTPECVTMLGKRSGKTIRMYPLTEDMGTFLKDMNKAAGDFYVGEMSGKVGFVSVTGEFDLNYRQVSITTIDPATFQPADTYTTQFIPTKKGIRLYTPVAVGDVTLDELYFDSQTLKITADDKGVQLKGLIPDDYFNYADFAGDYRLKIYNGQLTANVSLVPAGDGQSYYMTGLSDKYKVVLTYNKAKGRLDWNTQILGQYNGNTVMMAAWSLDGGGRFTWSTATGTELYWRKESGKTHPEFRFTPLNSDFATDSFILILLDADGNYLSEMTAAGWDPWGYGQLPYLTSLIKR